MWCYTLVMWKGCKCIAFSVLFISFAELFPKPILRIYKKDLDEGNTIRMSCLVNTSLPLNISLTKDNTFLTHSTPYAFTAYVANSGVYDCRAEMKGIVKKSDPVQIRVYCELIFRPLRAFLLDQQGTIRC